MKIERIVLKDGQFGQYSIVTIDGRDYSAFGRSHSALKTMKIGDDIQFTSEVKNGFDRITSIGGTATTAGSGPPAFAGRPAYKPKDPMEFNAMMATRYALDALIGNAAGTPKEAVKLVRDIFEETIKAPASEVPLEDQLKQLTTETAIDMASRPWKEYVFKRFKTSGNLSSLQQFELIDTLREVKEGKKRSVMTPDGFLTFVNS